MRLSAISEGVTDLDTDAEWRDVDEDVTCSICAKIVHFSDAKSCDACGSTYRDPAYICNNCTAEYEELNGELEADNSPTNPRAAWFADGCPMCSKDEWVADEHGGRRLSSASIARREMLKTSRQA